jgi:hypothetical protein
LTSAAAWAITACTEANGANDTSFEASLIAEDSECSRMAASADRPGV